MIYDLTDDLCLAKSPKNVNISCLIQLYENFFLILKNKFGINAHQCNTHKYA